MKSVAPYERVITAPFGVNLYVYPDTSAKLIGILSRGTKVTVTEEDLKLENINDFRTWAKVQVDTGDLINCDGYIPLFKIVPLTERL